MEKLTNQHTIFLDAVREELSVWEENTGGSLAVRYLEMPWIAGDWFSFFVAKGEEDRYTRIVHRLWDRNYDMKRFSLGIFNLDRPCIREREAVLVPDQQQELEDIVAAINEVPDPLFDGIVLDGIDSRLLIRCENIQQEYRWNIGPDRIACFSPLVAFLKSVSFV